MSKIMCSHKPRIQSYLSHKEPVYKFWKLIFIIFTINLIIGNVLQGKKIQVTAASCIENFNLSTEWMKNINFFTDSIQSIQFFYRYNIYRFDIISKQTVLFMPPEPLCSNYCRSSKLRYCLKVNVYCSDKRESYFNY